MANKKIVTHKKMDIEKANIAINIGSQTDTQSNTTVRLSTFPETFVGAKIVLALDGVNSTSGFYKFALIRLPEGFSVNSLVHVQGAPVYIPEEDVLWYDTIHKINSTEFIPQIVADVKTKRKLKPGDKILLVINGEGAVSTLTIFGSVTSWYKS